MNHKNHVSLKANAASASPAVSASQAGLVFRQASVVEFIDGVHSQWPKAIELKQVDVPSNAAQGDDGAMNAPLVTAQS